MAVPQFQYIGRAAVLVMLVALSAGVAMAAVSLVRHERAVAVPLLGLAVNATLIGLFRYLKFFALGFDQDRWDS